MKKAKLLAQVKGRSQCSEDVGLFPGVTKGYVYNSKRFTVIPTKFQGCTMILMYMYMIGSSCYQYTYLVVDTVNKVVYR